MQLLIVIVNYRTPELTAACLHSLRAEAAALPGTRVVIVDNASGDGSAEKIQAAIHAEGASAWAELLPLEANAGFAAGNNAAIAPALAGDDPPDYVLLLNPDTEVRPGAVQALAAFMETRPDAAIAGSRLEHPDGTPQHSAFRFHSAASEFDGALRLGLVSKLLARRIVAPPISDEAIRTDWVSGASMMIRRQVFEDVGLLDDGYFLYYEEMDFCLAARRAGRQCWYVPESRVVHLVGQATGVDAPTTAPKRRPPYWFEARRRFFVKNYGGLRAAAADAAWIAGYCLWTVRRLVQRRPNPDPPRLFRDFLRHSVFAKGTRL